VICGQPVVMWAFQGLLGILGMSQKKSPFSSNLEKGSVSRWGDGWVMGGWVMGGWALGLSTSLVCLLNGEQQFLPCPAHCLVEQDSVTYVSPEWGCWTLTLPLSRRSIWAGRAGQPPGTVTLGWSLRKSQP
jgi:hypothetical protein